jgi:hypothetical protein
MTKEKILQMIKSRDPELSKLGIYYILEKGLIYLKDFLILYGRPIKSSRLAGEVIGNCAIDISEEEKSGFYVKYNNIYIFCGHCLSAFTADLVADDKLLINYVKGAIDMSHLYKS